MIRINLLPFRAARRKENVRRQVSIFCLFFIFISIGLFYYHLTLGAKIGDLKSRVDTVRQQLKTKRKAAQEVDRINKALDLLKLKMDGIKTVKQRRREPVDLLETMTQVVVPKRMWFTSFTADNTKVRIKGIALDQKTVADFMTRLEECGLFSDVNLATIKLVQMEGLNLKSFEFACDKVQLNTGPVAEKKQK
jgi:type IV pilus assembly protein PilN